MANADANGTSIARKSRSALDGIDVSMLDDITLSVESVAIVERLLRACNIWEDKDDGDAYFDKYEEKSEEVLSKSNNDDGGINHKYNDYQEEDESKSNTDRDRNHKFNNKLFTTLILLYL